MVQTINNLIHSLICVPAKVVAVALAFVWIFSSCEEATEVEREGAVRITPHIVIDPKVTAASGDISLPEEYLPLQSAMSFSLSADDGRYDHTWESIGQYPSEELLRPGRYTARTSSSATECEGIARPLFSGSQSVMLESGSEQDVTLKASLVSSAIEISFDQELVVSFASVGAVIHSAGYSYVDYPSDETRLAFVNPGDISLALSVTTEQGQSATVNIAGIDNSAGGRLYKVRFVTDGAQEPLVTAFVDDTEVGSIHITGELLAMKAPAIIAEGFVPGVPVNVPEGDLPADEIAFSVTEADAASLVLNTIAPSLISKGWPAQIDLAKAPDNVMGRLADLGLGIERNASGTIRRVVLSDVIGHLRYNESPQGAKFILSAVSAAGKMSQPVSLDINLLPVTISVVSVSDIIIGVNVAEIVLLSHSGDLEDNLSIEALDSRGAWVECPVENIERRGEGEYAVRFQAIKGTYSQLPVRIIYCGNVLANATLKRVSPSYSISVDPYALSAMVRIETPDSELRALITSMVNLYVDGNKVTSLNRQPDEGVLYIGSLEPNRSYRIKSAIISNPSEGDFTPETEIRTERTLQVENSDFEDRDDAIKFAEMPSGGRYSQSIIDIFNRQNHTSFKVQVPRRWANTNSKTFCTAASNINTWYLEPSVISEVDNIEGYFAVKLQSVAWDVSGEEIANYRQKPDNFLPYNPNVPHIKYRAAGKLFLGSYAFDPATLSETYTEGIPFTSRPVNVNGTYRFTPGGNALGDCGAIIVKVFGNVDGREQVIASSTSYLPAALTYTAFSVPLSYDGFFGVKATRLSIMISSSRYVGDIDYESSNITTLPDPVTASSIGGTLWVQGLTLSYF